jgi:hypothetical protein
MALNLKNPQTLQAIDELARLTGESKSQVVASAIEARMAQFLAADEADRAAKATPEDRLRAIVADSSARFARAGLGVDRRGHFGDPAADLYDDAGLPR